MGLLDSGRDKAAASLASANRDIEARAAEYEKAKASLDQIMQAADDREVANRSAQEAEIKDLEIQVKDAQSKLDTDTLLADVLNTVTDLPLISGPTESLRQSASAIVAQDQAEVDQLQAQLSTAKAELATPHHSADDAVIEAQARADRAKSRLAMAQARQQLAQKAIDTLDNLKEG
jgi:DNA repair exonuclease SbcCD ATPase subunit